MLYGVDNSKLKNKSATLKKSKNSHESLGQTSRIGVGCLMLEVWGMKMFYEPDLMCRKIFKYHNVFPSKGESTIFSPLARWTWLRLSRRVRRTGRRSPKLDSSTLPGSSPVWTTARPAGWLTEAFAIPSPGPAETVVPPSLGSAALASHLHRTSMGSTATSQRMNEYRSLPGQKCKVDTDFSKICILLSVINTSGSQPGGRDPSMELEEKSERSWDDKRRGKQKKAFTPHKFTFTFYWIILHLHASRG